MISLIIALAAMCGTVAVQQGRIRKIKDERDIQLRNKEVLLGESVRSYKVADSLNAVSVRELALTRGEFEKYRSETAKTVDRLEADRKNLENVTAMQTQAIYELRNLPVKTVTDTLYMPGTEIDIIEYSDRWIDLGVKIYADSTADVNVANRESLIYTEWIKRKRFLWFRYGTKERRQEIVSLNPNTEIIGAEYVTIRN